MQYTACGHFNAAATFYILRADTSGGASSFAKVTHVMVSGGSAGGIGAFAQCHAHYVCELPTLKGADVRAAPYCVSGARLAPPLR